MRCTDIGSFPPIVNLYFAIPLQSVLFRAMELPSDTCELSSKDGPGDGGKRTGYLASYFVNSVSA